MCSATDLADAIVQAFQQLRDTHPSCNVFWIICSCSSGRHRSVAVNKVVGAMIAELSTRASGRRGRGDLIPCVHQPVLRHLTIDNRDPNWFAYKGYHQLPDTQGLRNVRHPPYDESGYDEYQIVDARVVEHFLTAIQTQKGVGPDFRFGGK